MKIKQIVGIQEDDSFGKIANVDQANKKVTIQKPDGTKMDVPSTAVMPDPAKPGSATIDASATTGDLKPGEVVNAAAPTSETQDEEVDEASMPALAAHQMLAAYNELTPHIEKHRDQQGAENLYDELKKIAYANGASAEFSRMIRGAQNSAHLDYDTHPRHFKDYFWYIEDTLKHLAARDHEEGGIEVGEEQDTIASGNKDVGGDATDRFIDQIKDRAFDKANRKGPTRSSLPESDELMKWLTIAGIK
jgi:hypothetical protein